MSKRNVIVAVIVLIAIAALIGVVQYIRSMAGETDENPGASNAVGPAEGGALETGGALDQENGYKRLPARDMPDTIEHYPPKGPETASPPPPRDRPGQTE